MSGAIEARRAIEALRAGVPNEAAVHALESVETKIGNRFRIALDAASAYGNLTTTRGLLIAGGYGAGKSHLLGQLRLQALANNFIVSHVSISKETPLYDLRKVYAAAMRNATVPNINDDVMRAVVGKLSVGDALFEQLEQWASSKPSFVPPIFGAILFLLSKSTTGPDLIRRFERFLAGAKLNKSILRQALKECGARNMFDLKYSETAIAPSHLAFAPRLMRAAGYRGWCVLLDEVELIGRYTLLQRGKAYAELGRWLGLDGATAVEGLVSVAAITDDFATEVIIDKRDNQLLEPKLRAKGLEAEAGRAVVAMQIIQSDAVLLNPPTETDLARDMEKVRQLYALAYNWSAPEIKIGSRDASKLIRAYIRSWIAQWDILRLYGEQTSIEISPIQPTYDEMPELEEQSAGSDIDDS